MESCPDLLQYKGVFRAGGDPPSTITKQPPEQVSIIQWDTAPRDPAGSGHVLQLGVGSRSATSITYTTEIEDASGDLSLWPFGTREMTYRVSASVMLSTDFLATSGSELFTIKFWDENDDVVEHSIVKNAQSLPSSTMEWFDLFVDVEVHSLRPLEKVSVSWGGNIQSTRGSLYLTELQVLRFCEGLPPGPALWFRADRGPPQVDGSRIESWDDVMTGIGGRFVTEEGDSAAAPAVKLDCLNGLPCMAFDQDDSLFLDESIVPGTRDITMFLVERHSGAERRFLQSRSELNFCLACAQISLPLSVIPISRFSVKFCPRTVPREARTACPRSLGVY